MILSLHVKLARAALNLTQDELSENSFVSPQTIKKIETTSPNEKLKNNKSTIIALMKFFEDNGVEFIDDGDSLGIKVDKKIIQERFD